IIKGDTPSRDEGTHPRLKNSGAKPLPLNSGAMAFLVPNSIVLTWHHFWSLAPRLSVL
ncbi:hypothetical protein Tco_0470578, partial [Tanacetum coccineum]